MPQYVWYLVIGLAIGLVSGALGIGGGVLMVPALMLLCGHGFDKARGTSLGVLAIPVALPGALEYFRKGHVDTTGAVSIAVSFALGGYLGAYFVNALPESAGPAIRFTFGLLMIFLSMRYILSESDEAAKAVGGLAAMGLALLAFWLLRLLGRHYPTPPDLGKKMLEMAAQEQGGPDYYI